jgi:rhodanese-related sulfurtransferase
MGSRGHSVKRQSGVPERAAMGNAGYPFRSFPTFMRINVVMQAWITTRPLPAFGQSANWNSPRWSGRALSSSIAARPARSVGARFRESVHIPHDEMVSRMEELDRDRVSILFCNGPQCPQSPRAIRQLLEAGYPAQALAYYRGGMHDWVTLAMPTQRRDD